MCRFHTEDYLVRSVSLRHPVLWSILKLLSSSAIALAIACVAYRMRHFIFTYACHMHEWLSYAMHAFRMPVICTYACHMHVCLPNARMPDICTYACKIHVFLPYVRTTYAYHMHVCLTYERMPDVCTYTWYMHAGMPRFAKIQVFKRTDFPELFEDFLDETNQILILPFFWTILRIFSVELKPLIFSPAVTGKTILLYLLKQQK